MKDKEERIRMNLLKRYERDKKRWGRADSIIKIFIGTILSFCKSAMCFYIAVTSLCVRNGISC